jgi:hypothetical protein
MDFLNNIPNFQKILAPDKIASVAVGVILGWLAHDYVYENDKANQLKIKAIESELQFAKLEENSRTYEMLDILLSDLKYDKDSLIDDIESIIDDIASHKDESMDERASCADENIPDKDCYNAYWADNQVQKLEDTLTEKKQQLSKKDERMSEITQLIIKLRTEVSSGN